MRRHSSLSILISNSLTFTIWKRGKKTFLVPLKGTVRDAVKMAKKLKLGGCKKARLSSQGKLSKRNSNGREKREMGQKGSRTGKDN